MIVTVSVGWERRRWFRVVEERGLLTADAGGIVVGDSYRWTWLELRDLHVEDGIATYFVIDARRRPRRIRVALLDGEHALAPAAATKVAADIRRIGAEAGWTAEPDPRRMTQGDRAERFAARTAAFTRMHPDALVIRTAGAIGSTNRALMVSGFGFATSTRYGHLVADATGLRMYQGLDDLEWEKPWREVTAIALSGDERAIKLEALGWGAPKFIAPCEPNGDVLLPFAVKDVLAQLRARRPATGVR